MNGFFTARSCFIGIVVAMYGKIFRQIYASSIAEDYMTRFVFMDLIVLADSDGVVDMTPEAISRTTNVPIDVIRDALCKLCKPDPRSRSTEFGGARLRQLDDHRDWGWQIVNYIAYREMRHSSDRKAYMRNYMRDYRGGSKKPDVNSVSCVNTQQKSSADVNCVNTVSAMLAKGDPSPSSYIVQPTISVQQQKGGTGGNGDFQKTMDFMARLRDAYGRPKDEPFDCQEQSAICELVRTRPGVVSELNLMLEYRRNMEDRRFFPKSVFGLVTAWNKTLDAARGSGSNVGKKPYKGPNL